MYCPTYPKKSIWILCLCLFFSLTGMAAAWAQKASLSGIVVTVTEKQIYVSTAIKNAFSKEMEEALKNGIPATFSFDFRLENSRKIWPDKTLSAKKATHSMTYDPLKGKYRVTRSWEKKDKPFITASFEEARDRMCKIQGMRLTRTKKLKKGGSYLVKGKAELEKISLPLYLHYVLFFVSFWDVETDWETVAFTY